jgi:hypothetical protein
MWEHRVITVILSCGLVGSFEVPQVKWNWNRRCIMHTERHSVCILSISESDSLLLVVPLMVPQVHSFCRANTKFLTTTTNYWPSQRLFWPNATTNHEMNKTNITSFQSCWLSFCGSNGWFLWNGPNMCHLRIASSILAQWRAIFAQNNYSTWNR